MKAGDYIRTEVGEIYKITKLDDLCIGTDYDLHSFDYDEYKEQYYFLTDSIEYGEVDKHYIIKSSPSIIDLIEVGDYVNGTYIEGNRGRYLETLEHDIENSSLGHIEYLKIYPKDIKSIVTHEQFKSMEYEVK